MDSKLVRIYHRGQLIKTHTRQPVGGRSTDVADYPPKIAPYTTRDPDHIKRQAARLGPAVGEFAQRLFDDQHPGPGSGRDTSCCAWASATPPSAWTPPASGPWTSTS